MNALSDFVLLWWERHPRSRFWVAQLAIWSGYATWTLIGMWAKLPPSQKAAGVVVNATVIVTGTTAAGLVRVVMTHLARSGRPVWARVVMTIAVVFAITWLWRRFDFFVLTALLDLTPLQVDWPTIIRAARGDYATALLAWAAGYAGLDASRRLRERQRALLEAEVLARDAQLRALAFQLNPHFLFNALNSIRALVLENPERTRTMLTRLAEFLRHSLALPADGTVTLSSELAALRSYLSVEEARFEEQLDVQWDVESGAESARVPGLLLQPLVENAIRHGEPDARGRLRIAIRATRNGGDLRLAVSNTGRLASPASRRTGMGIDNVRRRLAHAFPGRHAFDLVERDGVVTAAIDVRDA